MSVRLRQSFWSKNEHITSNKLFGKLKMSSSNPALRLHLPLYTIKTDKELTELEIENALVTYLNGDRLSGGYDPVYGSKRLEKKYGTQYKEILNDVDSFLSKFPQPNWDTQTLSQYLDIVEKYALAQFEWINPTLARAIMNYFAYQWR